MLKLAFGCIILIHTVLFSCRVVAHSSLCKMSEQVLFSCQIAKSYKILSLCGVKPTEKIAGSISYRFGIKQNVELEFPKNNTDSFNQFKFTSYFRGGGVENAGLDLRSVFFENNNTSYEIFSNYSAIKPIVSHGVIIDDGASTLMCNEPVVDNIHNDSDSGGWIYDKIKVR